tara:strand:+ start:356 stop:1489 length:1134 start_codon:yes stop_codon:yes gene_type:complete
LNKTIVFLSGTRADFGKLKSLIKISSESKEFNVHIFATGMHLQEEYGYTVNEIIKSGFQNIYTFANHTEESTMDLTLAKTIEGLSNFVKKVNADLLIVHGDRVEALAGAIVGSLNNILVGHIEGGEVSGTIDELIRHSISKLSHIHFVANEEAKNRLLQMGELENQIYVIGSPDIDIMFSENLPNLDEALNYYDIPYENYNILMYHPITTDTNNCEYATNLVQAVLEEDGNYIVIKPNNDMGTKEVNQALSELDSNPRFTFFPSLRFEYFLVLLKNCNFIIGNSSAGVREAPYYGVNSIDIGTRQLNRAKSESITHTNHSKNDIISAIKIAKQSKKNIQHQPFGKGHSNKLFIDLLKSNKLWEIPCQKQFKDRKIKG